MDLPFFSFLVLIIAYRSRYDKGVFMTRKRLRRIAAGAFVYAIAVPEGQIGVRYDLFYFTGTANLPLSGGEVSCLTKKTAAREAPPWVA